MKLTRERKILLALVGLGALAFMVDHFLIGPPQSAAASPMAGVAHVATGIVRTGLPVGEVVPPTGPTIADRLNALVEASDQQAGPSRDAFVLSAQWLNTTHSVSKRNPADKTSQQFEKDHRLLAVMVSGDTRIALVKATVKGKFHDIALSVGDVVNDFELIAVRVQGRDRLAVFRAKSGRTFVLNVPKPQ